MEQGTHIMGHIKANHPCSRIKNRRARVIQSKGASESKFTDPSNCLRVGSDARCKA